MKLLPSKLFRILLTKLSALDFCCFPSPVFDPLGGMSEDSFSRIAAGNQAYLLFFENAGKFRVHAFSPFSFVYTDPFNKGKIRRCTFVLQPIFLCTSRSLGSRLQDIRKSSSKKVAQKPRGSFPFLFPPFFAYTLYHCSPAFFAHLH